MSKTRKPRNPRIGSSLDDFLKAERIYEDVQTTALKRILAAQLEHVRKVRKFSKPRWRSARGRAGSSYSTCLTQKITAWPWALYAGPLQLLAAR